jgi:hypothetical protein
MYAPRWNRSLSQRAKNDIFGELQIHPGPPPQRRVLAPTRESLPPSAQRPQRIREGAHAHANEHICGSVSEIQHQGASEIVFSKPKTGRPSSIQEASVGRPSTAVNVDLFPSTSSTPKLSRFPTASNNIHAKPHHCSSQHTILSVRRPSSLGNIPLTLMSKFQSFRRFGFPHSPSCVFIAFKSASHQASQMLFRAAAAETVAAHGWHINVQTCSYLRRRSSLSAGPSMD